MTILETNMLANVLSYVRGMYEKGTNKELLKTTI